MNLEKFAQKYLEVLNGPLKGLNLTRILSLEEFKIKQVLDSTYPFEELEEVRNTAKEVATIVDVGFGGGFPLFPMSLFFPNKKIVGIESIRKKVDACKLIASNLGISNVKLLNFRVEKIVFDFDCLITVKAVAKISDFLKLITVADSQNVKVLFFKGPTYKEELDFINKNWKKVFVGEYKLPDASFRSVILYEFVPHGTNKNKNLVKLSELILD